MFNSSICKHTNKWGKNKGNICGKPSKKKDSRCHKHRYRFLQFLNKIYISFKYLFEIKPNTISNKKQIKKLLEKKENDDFKKKMEQEKKNNEEILKVYKGETFSEYVNRIDNYTNEILKTKDKKVVHNLIIDKLYNILNINYSMGTSVWVKNCNLILMIQRKYDFF